MSEYIVDLTDVEKRQFTWSIETLCNSVPVRGEIVRCRDCAKWRYRDDNCGERYGECDEFTMREGTKYAQMMYESGFCSLAKKKEDSDD